MSNWMEDGKVSLSCKISFTSLGLLDHCRYPPCIGFSLSLLVISFLIVVVTTGQLCSNRASCKSFFCGKNSTLTNKQPETSDKPCDIGSSIATLTAEFPQFDFSKVDPAYPTKEGPYAFTRSAVLQRGQTVLRSLYRRPERVIAVVSHSGFLRTAITNKQFGNADYRIYDFEDNIEPKIVDGVEIKFKLKERVETDLKGGGMGWSEVGHHGITDEDFPLADPVKRGPEEVVDEVPELQ